jgi:hypothetical protein
MHALLSLRGSQLEATLYLVGNPLVTRQITAHEAAGALDAPLRVALFGDAAGVHLAHEEPSTLFKSLGSAAIDELAKGLDGKIEAVARSGCGGAGPREDPES